MDFTFYKSYSLAFQDTLAVIMSSFYALRFALHFATIPPRQALIRQMHRTICTWLPVTAAQVGYNVGSANHWARNVYLTLLNISQCIP